MNTNVLRFRPSETQRPHVLDRYKWLLAPLEQKYPGRVEYAFANFNLTFGVRIAYPPPKAPFELMLEYPAAGPEKGYSLNDAIARGYNGYRDNVQFLLHLSRELAKFEQGEVLE